MPTVSNIIEIDLSTAIGFKVESHKEVHQWDQGIMLQFSGAEITAGAVCQFDGKSTTHNMIVDTSLGQVAIPNAVLGDDMNGDVKAHLQFTTNDYKIVVYDIHVPVIRRVRPATYISDPDTPGIEEWIAEQVSIIEQDKADIEAMGATASVDANVGTPSVTVTKTGGSGEPVSLGFEFHNLKGVQGEQGIQGPQGPTGPQGPQGPAGPPLPVVTSSDEGKVLTVDDQGEWVADDAPTGLPDVTSVDSGKVLTVDQNGSWVPAPPSGGGGLPAVTDVDFGKRLTVNSTGVWAASPSFYHGNEVPSSSDGFCVGDIYRNDATGDVYVCTAYTPRPAQITSLAGQDITMNTTVNFASAEGLPEYTYNCGSSASGTLQLYDGTAKRPGGTYEPHQLTVNGLAVTVYGWNYGSWNTNYTHNTSAYENVPFYWSSTGVKQRIIFPASFNSGQPAENQDVVDFFINNAYSLNNYGATWALVHGQDSRFSQMSYDSSTYRKYLTGWRGSSTANPTYSWEKIWQPESLNYLADGATVMYTSTGTATNYPLTSCVAPRYVPSLLWKYAYFALGNNDDLNTGSGMKFGTIAKTNTTFNVVNSPTSAPIFIMDVNGPNHFSTGGATPNNSEYVIRKLTDVDARMFIQKSQNVSGSYVFDDWKEVLALPIPTTDGTYTLKCTVTDGTPVYSWVADT